MDLKLTFEADLGEHSHKWVSVTPGRFPRRRTTARNLPFLALDDPRKGGAGKGGGSMEGMDMSFLFVSVTLCVKTPFHLHSIAITVPATYRLSFCPSSPTLTAHSAHSNCQRFLSGASVFSRGDTGPLNFSITRTR
jgi:hypothetical protein